MDGIFISYRREDSSGYAGRLYDRLAARFGRERVFMDVEGIDPGTDFVDAIDAAVASCTVLIVLIGPKWLGDDTGGARRIDDAHDFVRLETAAALRRKIRVLPVLVNDAEMPPEDALPPDLKALARRQAIEINHKQWEASTGEVLKALERIFGGGRPAWRLPAIVAAACCMLAAGAWLLWPGQHTADPVSPAHISVPESTDAEARRGSRAEPTQLASAEAPASPASAGSSTTAMPATPSSAAKAPDAPPAATAAEPPAPATSTTSAPSTAAPPPAPSEASPPKEETRPKTTTRPAAPARPQAATPQPQPVRPAPRPTPAESPPPAAANPRPAPPVAAASRLPQPGERWTYRSSGRWATSPKRTVTVTVDTLRDNAVVEHMEESAPTSGPTGTRSRWVGDEPRITHTGGLGSEFSPYLGVFASLQDGKTWKGFPTPELDSSWDGWYSTAEVLERDRVSVPAGRFNAWKLEAWASRRATGTRAIAALEPVRIHFLIWYAPEHKRYVKMERTLISAEGGAMEKDTIELVSGP